MRSPSQKSDAAVAAYAREPHDWRVSLALLTYLFYYPMWPWHVVMNDPFVYHVAVPWAVVAAAGFLVAFAYSPARVAALPRSVLLALLGLVAVHLVSALTSRGAMVVSAASSASLIYLGFAMLLNALPWRTRALVSLHRGLALAATFLAGLTVVRMATGAVGFIGPVSNPNTVAAMLIVGLAITGFGVWRPRGWAWLMLATQLVGLGATGSRAGMVAVATVFVGVATVAFVRRRGLSRRAGWALAGCGVVAMALLLGLAASRIRHEQRVEMWRGAVHMIADHPWLGVGPGQFEAMYPPYRTSGYNEFSSIADVIDDPHSFWLAITSETGVVGLLSWLALLAVVGHRAWSSPSPGKRAAILAWIALLIQNSGDQNLTLMVGQTWHFYLLGWIVARPGDGPMPAAAPRHLMPRVAAAGVAALIVLGLSVWRPLRAGILVFQVSNPTTPPDEVLRKFAEAHRLQPQESEHLWNYGFVATKTGRIEQAIEAYEEVRRISPDYAHVNLNLGVLRAGRGEVVEARRLLERELMLFPKRGEARQALARIDAMKAVTP